VGKKLAIAVSDDGARRLGVTDDVKQKLRELVEMREREALSAALQIKDLPTEQIAAKLAPLIAETERQGMELLTVDQRARLEQLRIAEAGMSTLAEPDVASVISLSDQQRKQVQDLIAKRDEVLSGSGDAERRAARDEYEQKLSEVLRLPRSPIQLAGGAAPSRPSRPNQNRRRPLGPMNPSRRPMPPRRANGPRAN
jgi:hypothetical protein